MATQIESTAAIYFPTQDFSAYLNNKGELIKQLDLAIPKSHSLGDPGLSGLIAIAMVYDHFAKNTDDANVASLKMVVDKSDLLISRYFNDNKGPKPEINELLDSIISEDKKDKKALPREIGEQILSKLFGESRSITGKLNVHADGYTTVDLERDFLPSAREAVRSCGGEYLSADGAMSRDDLSHVSVIIPRNEKDVAGPDVHKAIGQHTGTPISLEVAGIFEVSPVTDSRMERVFLAVLKPNETLRQLREGAGLSSEDKYPPHITLGQIPRKPYDLPPSFLDGYPTAKKIVGLIQQEEKSMSTETTATS